MQAFADTPEELLCPINQELMENPVVAADGLSDEKEKYQSFNRRNFEKLGVGR